MNYVMYDHNGNEVKRGSDLESDLTACPDGGSLSIELRSGVWLNIGTSEWMSLNLSSSPSPA